MNLLIIGGTRFVGYQLVAAALAAGHQVTLFHRGQTRPDAFPEVEHITGNRDGEIDRLARRSWDVVIDTCGYVPRVVRQSAEALKDAVQRYVFISTISVYDFPPAANADENAPLTAMDDPTSEDIAVNYGALKVLCENVVTEIYGDRALIIRPGLIVGPFDYTNRFNYWVRRVAQGGEVLAPGKPNHPRQFIDARDLGAWAVRMIEQSAAGVYNATGPSPRVSQSDLLATCKAVSGSDAAFTYVDEAFLTEHQVQVWTELPFWIPEDGIGIHQANIDRALAAGLTFRPLAETVRDALAWDRENPPKSPAQGGLPQVLITAEREVELLAAWHARS